MSEGCPFQDRVERELRGESSAEEQAAVSDHLEEGCKACEQLLARQFAAGGGAWLDEGLTRAMNHAADVMAPRRERVLAQVRHEIRSDAGPRRLRRRLLRAAFLFLLLIALALLTASYAGTRLALTLRRAQLTATRTELRALAGAIALLHRERGPLPEAGAPLLNALSAPRVPRRVGAAPRAYYPFEQDRFQRAGGLYLDPFGRPYRVGIAADRVTIYSVGPDGRDEQGRRGDDVVERVQLVD